MQAFFEGFNLSYNTIANNIDKGVIHGSYNTGSSWISPAVHYNNIYGNTAYDVINNDSLGKDAAYNWWGTSTSSEIDAKIFDFYDNPALGIINYSPTLIGPINIVP